MQTAKTLKNAGHNLLSPGLIENKSSKGAQSHLKSVKLDADTVGDRLAGESSMTGDNDVECAGLFAGKPAPTGLRLVGWIELIQRPVHRQFAQHDDLRNAQQGVAAVSIHMVRQVHGHDVGRGQ